MKILIIEDNILLLRVLEFRFEKEGYTLITSNDGRDALQQIKSFSPDLIITDIMMPYINGLEVVSVVRKELKLKTPIIMLSSAGLEKTVIDAFELGTDDFITKPFSPFELSIRVKKLLFRPE